MFCQKKKQREAASIKTSFFFSSNFDAFCTVVQRAAKQKLFFNFDSFSCLKLRGMSQLLCLLHRKNTDSSGEDEAGERKKANRAGKI
jgi:hypothetical protein